LWLLAIYKEHDLVMTKTIAELVWFAGLVGWYIIRFPFERNANQVAVRKSFADWLDWSALALAVVGLFLIPAVYAVTGFPASLDRVFIPAIAWSGLVPLAGALWLFYRSHVDLGRNWSVTLTVRERHRLITTGVYRLIRHPMYTSFFLLGFAQLLLLPNWLAGAAGPVGVGILFVFRVFREERMMIEYFGKEHRSYMAVTKRLIPWIL
jgi:protein-S-isoprenylcysteine O-methyltransferase Ste14